MGLSIITPHYNDFDGLKRIYSCLMAQTNVNWEWIIVDDFSDKAVLFGIENWKKDIDDHRMRFIESTHKSNASVCRNKGIEVALFDNLVFLDADDYIANDFVVNRNIKFKEFAIFPNFNIVDSHGINIKRQLKSTQGLLNSYLSAQFLWQTTCVLWNKEFLKEIGKFDETLHRLQDVELFIRALFISTRFKIIDNKVDFYYYAKPISQRIHIVKEATTSVNYLITKIDDNYELSSQKHSLIKGYYYACAKGLHRSRNRNEVDLVKESLKLFFKKNFINAFEYIIGYIFLFLYQYHIISNSLFLRLNRYFFK